MEKVKAVFKRMFQEPHSKVRQQPLELELMLVPESGLRATHTPSSLCAGIQYVSRYSEQVHHGASRAP